MKCYGFQEKLGPKCRHNDSYVKKQKHILNMWALVQENQNPGNEKGKKQHCQNRPKRNTKTEVQTRMKLGEHSKNHVGKEH